jgi:hypothetical protein
MASLSHLFLEAVREARASQARGQSKPRAAEGASRLTGSVEFSFHKILLNPINTVFTRMGFGGEGMNLPSLRSLKTIFLPALGGEPGLVKGGHYDFFKHLIHSCMKVE